MKLLFSIIVLPALMLAGIFHFDYKVLSEWKLKRISNDIEFSYRDVRVGDTLETREMRMRFSVSADPAKLVPYFKDPDLFMAWSTAVGECRMINDVGSEWTLYKFYDMPWPIAERDIVTTCAMSESDTLVHLKIRGVRSNVPHRESVKRMIAYEGQWFIRGVAVDSAEIEFRSPQLDKPVGPRALQERVVENSMAKSIGLLRQLASTQ